MPTLGQAQADSSQRKFGVKTSAKRFSVALSDAMCEDSHRPLTSQTSRRAACFLAGTAERDRGGCECWHAGKKYGKRYFP